VSARQRFDAGIFDLDGVVTRTARLHAQAWKRTFDEVLRKRTGLDDEQRRPFELPGDYLRYVDGKPRYEGVKSFLESRSIHLPYGDPSDGPERETVCGIGNRKQGWLIQMLDEEGIEVFVSTIDLIHSLRERGCRTAIVTSSKNGAAVLRAAAIEDLFDASVDGETLETHGLRGKPHADGFLEAAGRIRVPPDRAFVVEDAVSGVQAGRDGRFGLVIGVDRGSNRLALREAGADLVVSDLAEVSIRELQEWPASREHARPSALAQQETLSGQLAGKRLVVFLDYDGTLTPIVERPEMARLSAGMRRTLAGLARTWPTVIVSGRGREDVARLVGLEGIVYAGSHGFDIAGGGARIRHEVGAELVPEIARAARELARCLEDVSGVLIEEKRFSVAAHYRMVREDQVERVVAAVDRVLKGHPRLMKTRGKKVLELRPSMDWDKGKAVLWLMRALELDGAGVVPMYLGDDTTDEDAFVALRGRGVGIIVTRAPRPTAADYALQDPTEVEEFLRWLVESKESQPAT
jgi:alpha,alpha-trehalase